MKKLSLLLTLLYLAIRKQNNPNVLDMTPKALTMGQIPPSPVSSNCPCSLLPALANDRHKAHHASVPSLSLPECPSSSSDQFPLRPDACLSHVLTPAPSEATPVPQQWYCLSSPLVPHGRCCNASFWKSASQRKDHASLCLRPHYVPLS